MRHVLLALCLLLVIGCKPADPMAAGGVKVIMEVDRAMLDGSKLAHIDRTTQDAASRIKRRLAALNQSQSKVMVIGIDRIEIDLPRFMNVESANQLVNVQRAVALYHARTVATARYRSREYSDVPQPDPNDPAIWFLKDGKVIKPNDPDYTEMIRSWREPILSGEEIERADIRQSGSSSIPTMQFSPIGAAKMSAWSRKYYDTGEKLAWVIDGKVVNIGPLANGAIISDAAEVSGQFTTQYVKQLCDSINAGAMPRYIKEVSAEIVKPKG